MSQLIFYPALFAAHTIFAIAMLLAAWRMVVGPRAQDRVLGLDTLYVNALLLLVTFSIRTGDSIYMETALIIGLLGFTATAAFVKFMMRGEVIE